MQVLALLILILILGRALCKSCSNLDRFIERKSTFCVTMMMSLRHHSSLLSPQSTIQNFLKLLPPGKNEPDQPIIADSTASAAIARRVMGRVVHVERAFKPQNHLSVFQKVQLEGDYELEQFFADLKNRKEDILKETYKKTLGRKLEERLMYSNVGLILCLVADVYLAFLIFSPLAVEQGFTHRPLQICVLIALGAIDYPFRYFASVNQSAASLSDSIRRFRSSKIDWSYWSKDFTVGPELFSSVFAHREGLNQIIHHENKLEEVCGLLALTLLLENLSSNTQRIKLSVDILMWRAHEKVTLSVVLRSNATLQTVRDSPASAESLFQN